MKLLMVMTLLGSSLAFADVAPQPGEKITAEISNGAARILGDSMEQAETDIPAEITPVTLANGTPLKQAKVKVVDSKDSKVTIACFSFYQYGHQAICKMVEVYK